MTRRVKEYVEIADCPSLDGLIATLVSLRDRLPNNADAEMKLRGDDVFGRSLTISYFREQTAAEVEREARYDHARQDARKRELMRRLQQLTEGHEAPAEETQIRMVA
jgi:hypothetical protein